MVRKLTAAALFLGATFLYVPVQAESLGAPPPQAVEAYQWEPAAQQDVEAEGAESSDVDSINFKYMKGYVFDTGKILSSPLRWDTKDWLKAGVVLGVTSSLFLIDKNVKNFAQSHQNPVASKFASAGNAIGDPPNVVLPLGAFYLYGHLADDRKARRTSLLAMESFVISGLLTEGMKYLAQRHRPKTGHLSNIWDGPSFSPKNVSFSSGHTSTAFSIATVFADQYKDNPYVPPIAYGLATLTALSRIYSNEHWSSDTFFGAALGYFVSKAVLSYHKEDEKKSAHRLTVLPQVGKEMTGVSMQYKF